jgi:hypothetical protein
MSSLGERRFEAPAGHFVIEGRGVAHLPGWYRFAAYPVNVLSREHFNR